MAGIYLHIPFCKQACHYCNFHFSTSLKFKEEMVQALLQEIDLQDTYLSENTLSSVYFGGGTPSLLEQKDLERIFQKVQENYILSENTEITLEANPDDLSPEKLAMLADSPVNRLSIGIQSFFAKDLEYMNRAHTAEQATACLEAALQAGFTNLTIDLIYGTPTLSDDNWAENVRRVIDLGIPHISCYALTVEPGTALAHFVKVGKSQPVEEEQAARQFEYLVATLSENGYEHYEISNFALPGMEAVHNGNYWRGESYLGIGPSAHSYDGKSRQWNVSNNAKYLRAISDRKIPFEKEVLTPAQRYNEYIMTGLRTSWGVNLDRMEEPFRAYFLKEAQGYLKTGDILQDGDTFRLSPAAKFLADGIAGGMFWEE